MSVIHKFYASDDVTFRCQFEIAGNPQTPDPGTAKVKIIDSSGTPIVAETSASINGDEIYYKWQDMSVGTYKLFFKAMFNSGEDERTGIIEFQVITKGS